MKLMLSCSKISHTSCSEMVKKVLDLKQPYFNWNVDEHDAGTSYEETHHHLIVIMTLFLCYWFAWVLLFFVITKKQKISELLNTVSC